MSIPSARNGEDEQRPQARPRQADPTAAGPAGPTATDPVGPTRPAGPSWPTVAFGLVCLAVATTVLVVQTVDVAVDWRLAGPLALAGTGALVTLVGLVAVVLSRRR